MSLTKTSQLALRTANSHRRPLGILAQRWLLGHCDRPVSGVPDVFCPASLSYELISSIPFRASKARKNGGSHRRTPIYGMASFQISLAKTKALATIWIEHKMLEAIS